MISVVGRSSQLAPAFKASVQAVSLGNKAVVPGISLVEDAVILNTKTDIINATSMAGELSSGLLKIRCGPAVSTQVRKAHTDIQIPDFNYYRRESTKNPQGSNKETIEARNSFHYMIVGGGIVTGAYAAKSVVYKFISSMSASADVLALAKIEVNMSDVPEGKSMTFKWRGKPLFIKHRTAETIETEANVDVASLRDPQHDTDRVVEPEWLVVLGVCTHLGCVPIADAGDYGGYYCPCHGSHYDSSGRIRKGPAPLNLEVPPVELAGGKIIVG